MPFSSPQCECTTSSVQKMASVTGLVMASGSSIPGMHSADTTRSAVHMPTWSPLPPPRREGLSAKCLEGTNVERNDEDEGEATTAEGREVRAEDTEAAGATAGRRVEKEDDVLLTAARADLMHLPCWRRATDMDSMAKVVVHFVFVFLKDFRT